MYLCTCTCTSRRLTGHFTCFVIISIRNILFLRVKGLYSLPDALAAGGAHTYTVCTPSPSHLVMNCIELRAHVGYVCSWIPDTCTCRCMFVNQKLESCCIRAPLCGHE